MIHDTAFEFLGNGFAFPVAGPSGLFPMAAAAEKIRQSIVLILETSQNERLMRPEFGCGIHDLVDQPNTAALHGMVATRVADALGRWEPRIDVINVDVRSAEQPTHGLGWTTGEAQVYGSNVLLIDIEYRVRENNAVFNLVYPFFLNEGVGLGSTPQTGGAP